MHHFQYRGNELYGEAVAVRRIAEAVGTPFYLYSRATLQRHYKAFDSAFAGIDRLVCFSAKANTNLAVLNLFARLGGGLDIVSGGELYRGLQAGFSPERIVYSGVGKTVEEIDFALQSRILMFNVESVEELELIDQRAAMQHHRAPVAIRVNPDVDARTHPYISTGLRQNKFGIDTITAMEAYRKASRMANIRVMGIDCHIGSQITQAGPFTDALKNLVALVRALQERGVQITHVDVGGGLGITYQDEAPPPPQEYAHAIATALEGLPIRLILEPGRVIVGNAGVLVTRVLYVKTGPVKNFIVVDAGMNDLLRPTLYKAFHGIQPVVKSAAGTFRADVVGPICESSDFLAQDRELPRVRPGDLLAVMSSGAYGFVMASNYCSRPRVAEVMVAGDRFEVVRRRETWQDLIRHETLPEHEEPGASEPPAEG